MDRDKDAKLTYEEFVDGSKQDPTIVQVQPQQLHHRAKANLFVQALSLYDGLV